MVINYLQNLYYHCYLNTISSVYYMLPQEFIKSLLTDFEAVHEIYCAFRLKIGPVLCQANFIDR